MEAWGQVWGGAVALGGILGVLGVIVAALMRVHKLANRFEAVEKMAIENAAKIEAQVKEFCSQDRRKLINDLNAQYKATGGNGDVKDIVKRTFALPLDKETEEIK